MQIATASVDVDHLAEQERSSIAEARRVATELVPGIGLRHRRRPVGHGGPGEHRDALLGAQRVGGDAQLRGQRLVEREQPGR